MKFEAYDYFPKKMWEPAPKGTLAQTYGPGGVPKLWKLPDGRIVVDECVAASGVVEIAAFDNQDHPDIHKLPPNAPRAVKAVMRRENRLRYLRATDCGHMADFDAANEAWAEYSKPRLTWNEK